VSNAAGDPDKQDFGTKPPYKRTHRVPITTDANTDGNQFNDTTTKSNGFARNLIDLSPADFFFANATTLYVADTGSPARRARIPCEGCGRLHA
jgi:hypothetical protein